MRRKGNSPEKRDDSKNGKLRTSENLLYKNSGNTGNNCQDQLFQNSGN